MKGICEKYDEHYLHCEAFGGTMKVKLCKKYKSVQEAELPGLRSKRTSDSPTSFHQYLRDDMRVRVCGNCRQYDAFTVDDLTAPEVIEAQALAHLTKALAEKPKAYVSETIDIEYDRDYE